MVAVNPAASILPIVEKVAPERLEEVFWKAVALMPKDDVARERGTADARVADATIFLARYDRQVADVFLAQATGIRIAWRRWKRPVRLAGHPGEGGCRPAGRRGITRIAASHSRRSRSGPSAESSDGRRSRKRGHLLGRTHRRTLEDSLASVRAYPSVDRDSGEAAT